MSEKDLPPIFLNSKTGLCLVGEGAYEAQVDNLGSDESQDDIYNVQDVLLGRTPPIKTEVLLRHMKSDDLLEYGSFVMDLINPYKLKPAVFERANRMGLTPGPEHIYGHFGSFKKFTEALGQDFIQHGDQLEHWSISDYAQYIRDLADELGRKPTEADVNLTAKVSGIHNRKPSRRMINPKGMSLRTLYEFAGYPDINSFAKKDYLVWGAMFLFANEGNVHFTSGLKTLSKSKFGPSTRVVANHFGSISKYGKQSQAALDKILNNRLTEADKQEALDLLVSKKIIPENEPTSFIAKYLVIGRVIPMISEQAKVKLAGIDSELDFAIAVYEQSRKVTPWKLQAHAFQMGLLFDIWPPNCLDKLKVPIAQLNGRRGSIGQTAVVGVIKLPNGNVVKKLAPELTNVIRSPGSEGAKSIVAKLKEEASKPKRKGITIFGTAGESNLRQWRNQNPDSEYKDD